MRGVELLLDPVPSIVQAIMFRDDRRCGLVVDTLPHLIFVNSDDHIGKEAVNDTNDKKQIQDLRD